MAPARHDLSNQARSFKPGSSGRSSSARHFGPTGLSGRMPAQFGRHPERTRRPPSLPLQSPCQAGPAVAFCLPAKQLRLFAPFAAQEASNSACQFGSGGAAGLPATCPPKRAETKPAPPPKTAGCDVSFPGHTSRAAANAFVPASASKSPTALSAPILPPPDIGTFFLTASQQGGY